ncbi:MAG: DinB family protein [Acidobacteria bacterium]|nr:DinB family protein [Acidobacteriota bacterium]
MTESARIAAQLHHAFYGEAWHGPSVREVLDGITPEQARAHPLGAAHSIWELVLHITAWVTAPHQSIHGKPMPDLAGMPKEVDWPPVRGSGADAWESAKQALFNSANELIAALPQLGDERLRQTVPGRDFDFYFMLHGVVQHTLYHAGQIALLKKAAQAR